MSWNDWTTVRFIRRLPATGSRILGATIILFARTVGIIIACCRQHPTAASRGFLALLASILLLKLLPSPELEIVGTEPGRYVLLVPIDSESVVPQYKIGMPRSWLLRREYVVKEDYQPPYGLGTVCMEPGRMFLDSHPRGATFSLPIGRTRWHPGIRVRKYLVVMGLSIPYSERHYRIPTT